MHSDPERKYKNKWPGAIGSDWRGPSRTRKFKEEALHKNQVDVTSLGGYKRAIGKTVHLADRANIKKQMVRSDWLARVAHGKSRRRLRRRIRWMKPAGEGTFWHYGRRAIWQTERTFKNKRSGAMCVSLEGGGEVSKTLTVGHCFQVFSTIHGKTMAKHFCYFCSEALQSL